MFAGLAKAIDTERDDCPGRYGTIPQALFLAYYFSPVGEACCPFRYQRMAFASDRL
jgi:hypothetical protein